MKVLHRHKKTQERGAVSLFIVIFTALLVTTITMSFMQIMIRDQQQATYSDLSVSAYDSAMAGVEDAKRLLLLDYECRNGTASAAANCTDYSSALILSPGETETGCSTLVDAGLVGETGGETIIQQEADDGALNQAYTCVKITQDTSDYIGSIESDSAATLIALRAVDTFDKIKISWALNRDGGAVDIPSTTVELPVLDVAYWPENRPALLRAQLIHGGSSFELSDFDTTGHSNTLFLYPSDINDTPDFALDGRPSALGNRPQRVDCNAAASSGAYACEVTIPIGSDIAASSETTFLNLMAFYNRTDYKIELFNDSDPNPVLFDSVQPEIDSTGRANDLFRRVVSRVELNNTFNYPIAALETRNNICKNFSVTTETGDYSASPVCDPALNN